MSLDIITFEKPFYERYNEYMTILGSRGSLPASEVRNEWICYIQSVVEAGGWQAVWKIPRLKCEEFDISFPTVVLVMVKQINFEDLLAEIVILAVQDDISLPEEHMVPLMNLYPTKQQESGVLAIPETANCLDQFRLFYNRLWQPWDCDDENVDWLSTHLHRRLTLLYDMQKGVLSLGTTQHICSLLQEARDIEHKIRELEDQNCSSPDEERKEDNENFFAIIELQIRREQIKREFEILENPDLRHIVIKKKEEDLETKRRSRRISDQFCFVWLGGKIDELIENLNKIKSFFCRGNISIKACSLLQEGLNQAIPGDTIIICPGIHGLHSFGGLGAALGEITGYMEPSATTIMSCENRTVFLDLDGGMTFRNLTIDAKLVKIAVAARTGLTRLQHCRIIGNSSNQTGILVESDMFEASECEFVGFGIGIVLESRAEALLSNCKITCCNTGLKISEGARVQLNGCKISECYDHGVQYETVQNVDDAKDAKLTGLATMLDKFDKIKMKETVVEQNRKGDVLLVQRKHDSLYEFEDSRTNFSDVRM